MSDVPCVRDGNLPAAPREVWPSTMSFPQALREAIPSLEPCSGRVLVLDSFHLHSLNTPQTGPRVQAILTVKETGKLTGSFEVLMDLTVDAARVLASKLLQLADEAEQRPSVPLFGSH